MGFKTEFLCSLMVLVTRPTTIGDRAFAVAGPRAWNNLPDFITDCSSLHTFKQYLKTYRLVFSYFEHLTPCFMTV